MLNSGLPLNGFEVAKPDESMDETSSRQLEHTMSNNGDCKLYRISFILQLN